MIIKPAHFKYLYIQRGEVSDAFKQGFDHWQSAYEESLKAIAENIEPALPADCRHVLDVGGGMGGIGILLGQRYERVRYSVLDGTDDPAEVRSHHFTFNNASVAKDFLNANGMIHCQWYPTSTTEFSHKFDLVVSFAAWGFHIIPGDYLELVESALAPGATIILDVRKSRPDYLRTLLEAFGEPQHVLQRGKKHVRLAWRTTS
jgi:cyclopropane fatty-acyl-phospholipid synthase-like methyltransferase